MRFVHDTLPQRVRFASGEAAMALCSSSVNGDGPSLSTAVREQLGLRLDSTRAPVDVVVVDRVTAPTEN